jgi:SAM-dependent methyltransferase
VCHTSCIIFGATSLTKQEVEGKRVIEVGSRDVNGSLRPIVESFSPAKYVGIDIMDGPGVDIICSAGNLLKKFGKESFDIVISTELLEHVRDWRKAVSNMKNVCRPDGILLVTARSYGFVYHGYPYDFWRYELKDMRKVFADFAIDKLEKDGLAPGVFMKARKPSDFVEKDLSKHDLYSILVNRRVREIDDKYIRSFARRYAIRHLLGRKIYALLNRMARLL